MWKRKTALLSDEPLPKDTDLEKNVLLPRLPKSSVLRIDWRDFYFNRRLFLELRTCLEDPAVEAVFSVKPPRKRKFSSRKPPPKAHNLSLPVDLSPATLPQFLNTLVTILNKSGALVAQKLYKPVTKAFVVLLTTILHSIKFAASIGPEHLLTLEKTWRNGEVLEAPSEVLGEILESEEAEPLRKLIFHQLSAACEIAYSSGIPSFAVKMSAYLRFFTPMCFKFSNELYFHKWIVGILSIATALAPETIQLDIPEPLHDIRSLLSEIASVAGHQDSRNAGRFIHELALDYAKVANRLKGEPMAWKGRYVLVWIYGALVETPEGSTERLQDEIINQAILGGLKDASKHVSTVACRVLSSLASSGKIDLNNDIAILEALLELTKPTDKSPEEIHRTGFVWYALASAIDFGRWTKKQILRPMPSITAYISHHDTLEVLGTVLCCLTSIINNIESQVSPIYSSVMTSLLKLSSSLDAKDADGDAALGQTLQAVSAVLNAGTALEAREFLPPLRKLLQTSSQELGPDNEFVQRGYMALAAVDDLPETQERALATALAVFQHDVVQEIEGQVGDVHSDDQDEPAHEAADQMDVDGGNANAAGDDEGDDDEENQEFNVNVEMLERQNTMLTLLKDLAEKQPSAVLRHLDTLQAGIEAFRALADFPLINDQVYVWIERGLHAMLVFAKLGMEVKRQPKKFNLNKDVFDRVSDLPDELMQQLLQKLADMGIVGKPTLQSAYFHTLTEMLDYVELIPGQGDHIVEVVATNIQLADAFLVSERGARFYSTIRNEESLSAGGYMLINKLNTLGKLSTPLSQFLPKPCISLPFSHFQDIGTLGVHFLFGLLSLVADTHEAQQIFTNHIDDILTILSDESAGVAYQNTIFSLSQFVAHAPKLAAPNAQKLMETFMRIARQPSNGLTNSGTKDNAISAIGCLLHVLPEQFSSAKDTKQCYETWLEGIPLVVDEEENHSIARQMAAFLQRKQPEVVKAKVLKETLQALEKFAKPDALEVFRLWTHK